jgi:hypothetical protein
MQPTKEQLEARERFLNALVQHDLTLLIGDVPIKIKQGQGLLATELPPEGSPHEEKTLYCCCLGVSCLVEKNEFSPRSDGAYAFSQTIHNKRYNNISAYPQTDWFSDKYGVNVDYAEPIIFGAAAANDELKLSFSQIAAWLKLQFENADKGEQVLNPQSWWANRGKIT